MSQRKTLLTNARVVLGPAGTDQGEWDIAISAGKIESLTKALPGTRDASAAQIDCRGLVACPGFVDLHIHGGKGSDFMDATEEDFRVIAGYHAAGGTTAYFPTTASDSLEALTASIDLADRCRQQRSGAVEILGVHVEGPYFNPNKNGCHDPAWVRPLSKAENRAYLDRAHIIRRITLAPELPGAREFIRDLTH